MIVYPGKSHNELVDAGFISWKTYPKGHSGSMNQHLEMAKEGINLSFLREAQALGVINLKLRPICIFAVWTAKTYWKTAKKLLAFSLPRKKMAI
ncbi:DUF6392 family protein [Enterobacter cloacae]|uniref:DUF6392 family protein n=1 Tax=Enterobacter cloacae TaxID=550 RepID=UPI0010575F3D|nr:DUF6392 family protein [Enterobacter cloacae]